MDDFKRDLQNLDVGAYNAGEFTPIAAAQGQYEGDAARLCIGFCAGFGFGACGGFGGGFGGGFLRRLQMRRFWFCGGFRCGVSAAAAVSAAVSDAISASVAAAAAGNELIPVSQKGSRYSRLPFASSTMFKFNGVMWDKTRYICFKVEKMSFQ
ncbi:hypothetical protein [Cohnella kolymensis]|uniref:hypothetical protein n=1 Tax=Cohnella kolymensis TaxID=1590652 RepID=UPI000696A1DF|nr:hypothetical protein [Cohnella kolymensis]